MADRLIPRVTEVLDACGLGYTWALPRDKRDFYLARGAALHRAIELHAAGTLDRASVHPAIAGGLAAYEKFLVATNHRPMFSEVELVHPRWQFMGHPDRVGLVNDRTSLCDWKGSVDDFAVRYQLAGYSLLWEACHPEAPIEQYLAVKLGHDGSWTMHPVDPRPHQQVFLAALVVYRAREERRKEEAPYL